MSTGGMYLWKMERILCIYAIVFAPFNHILSMAKPPSKKKIKTKRAEKYDTKLAVHGTFLDIMKASAKMQVWQLYSITRRYFPVSLNGATAASRQAHRSCPPLLNDYVVPYPGCFWLR